MVVAEARDAVYADVCAGIGTDGLDERLIEELREYLAGSERDMMEDWRRLHEYSSLDRWPYRLCAVWMILANRGIGVLPPLQRGVSSADF